MIGPTHLEEVARHRCCGSAWIDPLETLVPAAAPDDVATNSVPGYLDSVDRERNARAKVPGTVPVDLPARVHTKPVTELGPIGRFIGSNFDPSMLLGLGEPGRWTHREQSSDVFDEIMKETKNWRDHLTPTQAATIQHRLGPLTGDLEHVPYDVSSLPRPMPDAVTMEP